MISYQIIHLWSAIKSHAKSRRGRQLRLCTPTQSSKRRQWGSRPRQQQGHTRSFTKTDATPEATTQKNRDHSKSNHARYRSRIQKQPRHKQGPQANWEVGHTPHPKFDFPAFTCPFINALCFQPEKVRLLGLGFNRITKWMKICKRNMILKREELPR